MRISRQQLLYSLIRKLYSGLSIRKIDRLPQQSAGEGHFLGLGGHVDGIVCEEDECVVIIGGPLDILNPEIYLCAVGCV